MKSVFAGRAPGAIQNFDEPVVRELVLEALQRGEWVSTSMLHGSCYGKVSRIVLHNVLKDMLRLREIKMRVITPGRVGGRPRTEFKKIVSADLAHFESAAGTAISQCQTLLDCNKLVP